MFKLMLLEVIICHAKEPASGWSCYFCCIFCFCCVLVLVWMWKQDLQAMGSDANRAEDERQKKGSDIFKETMTNHIVPSWHVCAISLFCRFCLKSTCLFAWKQSFAVKILLKYRLCTKTWWPVALLNHNSCRGQCLLYIFSSVDVSGAQLWCHWLIGWNCIYFSLSTLLIILLFA